MRSSSIWSSSLRTDAKFLRKEKVKIFQTQKEIYKTWNIIDIIKLASIILIIFLLKLS